MRRGTSRALRRAGGASGWPRAGALVCTIAVLLAAAVLQAVPSRAGTYREQQGHRGANTFTNYHNASGLGPFISAASWVDVSCKVFDPTIASINPDGYWYRIATSPWNNNYYSAANTFMNGDPWGGPYTHNTDFGVPDCGALPTPAPPPLPPPPPLAPTVSLAQGPAAPSGYRYAITVRNFAPASGVSISCRDSVDPGGFYTFTLTTDGSGSGFTQSYCYSADGPDHWVVAGGVESNHLSWGSAPSSSPPPPPTPTPLPPTPQPVPVPGPNVPPAQPTVTLAQGPTAPSGYRYALTLSGFGGNASVSISCRDSVNPNGFYTFTLKTDGNGNSFTQSYCYSADGPDHWVIAGGIESNHVSWQSASTAGPGGSGSAGNAPPNQVPTPPGTPVRPTTNTDVCIAAYPRVTQTTHPIFGGSETDFDRMTSLYQQCEGFGAPQGLQFSPEMKCALMAAALTYGGLPAGFTLSNVCDAAGLADSFVNHDWAGAIGGLGCSFFSDVFAKGIGILAAGATAEAGPAAIAVGLLTYNALKATLGVVCGGIFSGGASALGQKLEANHETAIAVDILDNGKCLHMRRVFGLIFWSAAAC